MVFLSGRFQVLLDFTVQSGWNLSCDKCQHEPVTPYRLAQSSGAQQDRTCAIQCRSRHNYLRTRFRLGCFRKTAIHLRKRPPATFSSSHSRPGLIRRNAHIFIRAIELPVVSAFA
eukprot:428503-Amphidinium_carterae.1